MENKLNKLDLFAKSIVVAIIICIAYIFGYPDGGKLIIIGLLIVTFGFWWKWYIYWNSRSGAFRQEMLLRIEEKLAHNQELTHFERFSLFNINSGPWMWRMCSKLGVVIIAIGFILLIVQ